MGEKGLMRRRERAVGASALFTILIFRKANLQYCTVVNVICLLDFRNEVVEI